MKKKQILIELRNLQLEFEEDAAMRYQIGRPKGEFSSDMIRHFTLLLAAHRVSMLLQKAEATKDN